MLVIGIETSGLAGSVALNRDGDSLEERSLGQAGRRHAQSLVLELRDLLRSNGATPRDVTAIAVSKGPGSFTGLRVGLVCAKTFAYATGCRFVAVDTFEAIAANCPPDVRDVWIVEDAQRGELFVGHYVRDSENSWRQTEPVQVVSAEEWLIARTSDEVVAGPGLARCEITSANARLLTDESFTRPRASVIARLGWRRLLTNAGAESSQDFNFWKAIPFYIRPSAAEEKLAKRTEAHPPRVL